MKGILLFLFAASGLAQVVIRGTPTISSYAASATVNVTLPGAAASGDIAIVSAANPNSMFPTIGWTGTAKNGANIGGITQYRTLNSTDISNGFVQITTDGSYPGIASIVVIKGPSSSRIRETGDSQNGTGAANRTLTTGGTVKTTDLGIYVGSARSGPCTSISPGSSVGTATSTYINGRLSTDTGLSAGANTITYNYSGSGGDYQSYVIVKLPLSVSVAFPILF